MLTIHQGYLALWRAWVCVDIVCKGSGKRDGESPRGAAEVTESLLALRLVPSASLSRRLSAMCRQPGPGTALLG